MTSSTQPAATPTFVAPQRSPRSAGQRIAIALGAAAALFGTMLILGGVAVLAVFGTDGVASTDRSDLSTTTAALVSGTATIDTDGVVDDLGDTRIQVDARADGGRPLFVGIGSAADVERYLSGAAFDEVTDLDTGPFDSSFGTERTRRSGDAALTPPSDESFWLERSSGQDAAAIDWKVRDGDYRLVIMNADGSPGVETRSALGIELPWLPGVGIGILVAGLLVTAGGIAAIVAGVRRR